MKILYFYQYFSTSKGSWGTRAFEFSKRWVQAGHEVTVVTCVYDKSDLSPSWLIHREKIEGI
ncbi:MAG: glycosyltransferase WbuB, partial [Verrucomicrobiota bacterium]|nr:glycosyltransferase WbuB [Verrucomicrobiota bacterium]